MKAPVIDGLSTRANELLERFGFLRNERERDGLATRLTSLGLPLHPLALELDASLGGLHCPRTRSIGWLELGVWEELDDTDDRSLERREALEESEIVGGTWPNVTVHTELVVPVGGGCDTAILAGKHCLYVHDRLLDEVTEGPGSPRMLVEQRLLAMALSAVRGAKGGATWEFRDPEELSRLVSSLQLRALPEASDEHESWWSDGVLLAVRTLRGGRLVGPEALVHAARAQTSSA